MKRWVLKHLPFRIKSTIDLPDLDLICWVRSRENKSREWSKIGRTSKFAGRLVFNKSLSGALILNSGYEPIKVVNWRKAICLWLQGKVEVLEFHAVTVHSPSTTLNLPAVIRLKQYIRPYLALSVRLSRQNVFLRDHHTCQYCRKQFAEKKLTIDHVVPLSKGGAHEWTNVVTACSACNNKKGDKSVEKANLILMSRPVRPKWLPNRDLELADNLMPLKWAPYLAAK
jgi:5-methylcytosine-specific restriction endonuclease McrA